MIRAFFNRLWIRSYVSLSPRLLIWHVVAIVLTALLVLSGFDWWFYGVTRIDVLYPLIMVAGLGGFLVPVVMPFVCYLYGGWYKKAAWQNAGIAMAQAALIAYIISCIYKIFAGRIQPEFLTHYGTVDISREFHFGFFQNGIFWGWPSSHAIVAFASAVALFVLIPRRDVRVAAIVWAFIVAAGAGIGFHWFSDVIAGAIIGTTVGVAVSRDAKSKI